MRKLFTIVLGIFVVACLAIFAERTMYVRHKTEGVLSFKIEKQDSIYFWNTVTAKSEDEDESELMMYIKTALGLENIPYKQVDSIYFSGNESYRKDGELVCAFYRVSASKSVRFSQGNLQFNAAKGTHATADGDTVKGTWRFAENQYDIVGIKNNTSIAEDYDGWIDLFGWGTSGWKSGAVAYQPWSTSKVPADYYPGGSEAVSLTDEYANADWGVYNAISNGENVPNGWRTLTSAEWQYLFENNKWTFGTIEDGLCFMLFPETFTAPDGLMITMLSDNATSASVENLVVPSNNNYTVAQFKLLERLGVVALPCGGFRNGSLMNNTANGFYWSASSDGENRAGRFLVSSTRVVSNQSCYRNFGQFVRLVREYCDIKFKNVDGTLLLDTVVVKGEMPNYTRKEPTKEATEDYTFQFKGWNKEIVEAEMNEVYTAVYDSTFIVKKSGVIRVAYKVSEKDSVWFSQGNLQFNAAKGTYVTTDGSIVKGTWRFAENQYDVVGREGNVSIAEDYDGWIDLLGWGTSGWNSGAKAYQPWSTSEKDSDYCLSNSLTDAYANADWGVFNAISNGGDEPNKWRTLTTLEWQYLVENNKWTLGNITDGDNSYLCFMLIPETFTAPEGTTVTVISTSTSSTAMDNLNVPTTNTYTTEQFTSLENLGVVALPCGGYRLGTAGYDVGSHGYYWSSSADDDGGACFSFCSGKVYSHNESTLYCGYNVRLVQDLVFDIHFVDADGTTLLDTSVAKGVTPTYTREVPTKEATKDYTFQFKGWNKEVIAAESDEVYIAVYDSTHVTKKNGALLRAVYKVSDSKSVYFSQGNLQFNAMQGTHATADGKTAKGTWRFAENQYDVIGEENANIDSTYTGWIDLFGWGTSGWNSKATCYQPWSKSTSYYDYYPGGSYSNNLTDTYANADWGVYNAISNGGNEPNKWRTLTNKEWKYLFQNNKWTLGYIKTTDKDSSLCFMLIPEKFTAPEGTTVQVLGTADLTSHSDYDLTVPSSNKYTTDDFASLEELGVVVLPWGGYRNGTARSYVEKGYYWESSECGTGRAFVFVFYSTAVSSSNYVGGNRCFGRSVRLVQDVK